ncbi:MAG: FAD-binding oxidoreductase [Rhizobiaceae bacterium]
MLSSELVEKFTALVGHGHALSDPVAIAPHLTENRDLYHGLSRLVLKPETVEEVSAILKLAHQTKTPIVPQGGNTGLVGGQTPDRTGDAIILSLTRMNKIRNIDPVGNTLTVEAGVVLKTVQDAAEEVERLFPLSLGSEGSAVIGGLLSSNAGGTAVLAYGNMRELCLGLEVVLPDGSVMHGLKKLRKDNTGYDLRDLFIGAEGTLGVITAAVLKLHPRPRGRAVAFAGLSSPDHALKLLGRAKASGMLTGFELIARLGMEFAVRHVEGARDPFEAPHNWYVLAEIASSLSDEDANAAMEQFMAGALEAEDAEDAVIAQSGAQADDFWHLRENLSWAQKPEGGSIKHDISVPVAAIPAFIDAANAAVEALIPGARFCTFGHMGDGNLHYNISQPVGADKDVFLRRWDEVNALVHDIVGNYDGSISAEHGIGQLKRGELQRFKDPVALDLMRRIKAAFDPVGIMNPGKVL